jgi:hypothetical protein
LQCLLRCLTRRAVLRLSCLEHRLRPSAVVCLYRLVRSAQLRTNRWWDLSGSRVSKKIRQSMSGTVGLSRVPLETGELRYKLLGEGPVQVLGRQLAQTVEG